MPSALTVRFRPAGPWRFGPENGARDRVDRVFHSDSLFSALTVAMRDLGWLDEWASDVAEASAPAVRISSCFPYSRRTLFVQVPRHLWPPAQTGALRWKAARFVPVSAVGPLLRGEELKEEHWVVDPASGCLLPVERNGGPSAPFRISQRGIAPVDRATGASEERFTRACLQFAPGAGMWFVAAFDGEDAVARWRDRLKSACRLLADTGIGGERSCGWGRSEAPMFEEVDFPGVILGGAETGNGEKAWWLLSLFSPADADTVDWARGNYDTITRSGRLESLSRSGELKPASRMVAEGSVVLSATAPVGGVRNVAAADVPHAVYRSGIALAVPVSWYESRRLSWLAAERQAASAPEPEPTAAPEVAGAIGLVQAGAVPERESERPEGEVAPQTTVAPEEDLPEARVAPGLFGGEVIPEPRLGEAAPSVEATPEPVEHPVKDAALESIAEAAKQERVKLPRPAEEPPPARVAPGLFGGEVIPEPPLEEAAPSVEGTPEQVEPPRPAEEPPPPPEPPVEEPPPARVAPGLLEREVIRQPRFGEAAPSVEGTPEPVEPPRPAEEPPPPPPEPPVEEPGEEPPPARGAPGLFGGEVILEPPVGQAAPSVEGRPEPVEPPRPAEEPPPPQPEPPVEEPGEEPPPARVAPGLFGGEAILEPPVGEAAPSVQEMPEPVEPPRPAEEPPPAARVDELGEPPLEAGAEEHHPQELLPGQQEGSAQDVEGEQSPQVLPVPDAEPPLEAGGEEQNPQEIVLGEDERAEPRDGNDEEKPS